MDIDSTILANQIVEKLVDFDMWGLIIKSVFVFVTLLVFKHIGESIVGYLKFRMNQNIMKGSRLIYDGEKGVVKKIGFFTILIETKKGWMPIQTKEWGDEKIIKLKDKNRKLRRRDDFINKEIKNENE